MICRRSSLFLALFLAVAVSAVPLACLVDVNPINHCPPDGGGEGASCSDPDPPDPPDGGDAGDAGP